MKTLSRSPSLRFVPFGVCSLILSLLGPARGQDYAFSTIAPLGEPRAVTVDGNGNLFVLDNSYQGLRKVAANGLVTTLDTSALFEDVDFFGTWQIGGLAADTRDNLFVSAYDAGPVGGTRSRIWHISPEGVPSIFADLGSSSGSAFDSVYGIGVDRQGNLYVAETDKHSLRKITPRGIVSDLAGAVRIPGSTDGSGGGARFNRPQGIAVDSLGNIFVADTGNHAIRKLTATGDVTTFAGSAGNRGSADGRGSAARFDAPASVAVDAQGNVYVADTRNHTIRKITPDGVVTTIAGMAGSIGSADAIGEAVRFNTPSGVAVDAAGNVFVADAGNNVIRQGTLRRAPAVLAQPQSQTIARGRTVALSAAASGSPPPSYQWWKDGVPVAGATDATLLLTGVSAAHAGSYQCVITNTLGTVTSAPASVSVVESSGAARFNNFSVRAFLNTGRSFVAGFVVDGEGQKTVLVRGIGPALASFGVSGTLADPKLEIFSSSGVRLAENDNWPASLAAVFVSTGAFGFPPGSRDAAVLLTLPPGVYTAVLGGMGGATGEALIEIYGVP